MTGYDSLFGPILAIIYRCPKKSGTSSNISSILISSHGTSGFVNMTLDHKSRYFVSCQNLPEDHRNSLVRKALAISCLRSFATMDSQTRANLISNEVEKSHQKLISEVSDTVVFDWDETTAGSLASKFMLADGKYPKEIGQALIDTGVIEPKLIQTNAIDVVYEDDDQTIDHNNELVYLLGEQLEQLFDPLTEYSPEHTERLYIAPLQNESYDTLSDETELVRTICEELYLLQSHVRVDLMDFLHEFLIPLRVQVLGEEEEYEASGETDNEQQQSSDERKLRHGRMTIRKLNTIFPPTIDEIVRINNIFYDALQQSLPFGSYEIIKACGTTIPYFYKACMRHEAATKNLSRNLNYHLSALHLRCPKEAAKKYTPRKIESILQCGLHLTKIKLILDRLVKTKQWTPEEKVYIDEYYQSAVGTIDAFGKQHSVAPYERLIFTPTGKILVEVASGWPKELEYGWLNRRVVTIFDAVDVLADDNKRHHHHVIILFTDTLVILEPKRPIPMVSASGLHIPSVADMLMHSMINEVPLHNVPDLSVVAWSTIENIQFSEYNNSRSISILATGDGFFSSDAVKRHLALYQLVRPDYTASKIVELVTKAKITNKTQPFHLFRTTKPQLTLYSTVHELQGYIHETRKLPIAVFLNLNGTKDIMRNNNLAACINVEFVDHTFVKVNSLSFMDYESEKLIHKSKFPDVISSEVAYLFTLFMSSANRGMIDCIISSNQLVTKFLVDYALNPSAPPLDKQKSRSASLHKRYMVTSPATPVPLIPEIVEEQPQEQLFDLVPPSKIAASQEKRRVSPVQFLRQKVVKGGTTNENIQKKTSFNFLRGILGSNEQQPNLPVIEPLKIEHPTPMYNKPGNTPVFGGTVNFESPLTSPGSPGFVRVQKHSQLNYNRGNIASDDEDYEDWEDMSSDGISIASQATSIDKAEQQEQRDVEEWFNNISDDEADLDSIAPEFDETIDDEEVQSIQLTKFLDPVVRDTYNRHARTGSYAIVRGSDSDVGSVSVGDVSVSRGVSDSISENDTYDTIAFEDDFSYLAGLVGDEDTKTTESLPISESRRLYPDLRDDSVRFLAPYIRSGKNSSSDSGHSISSSIGLARIKQESSWETFGTNSNNSTQQVRNVPSVSELGFLGMKQSYEDLPRPIGGQNSLAHARRQPSLQMQFEFPPKLQQQPPPLPAISPSFRRMINASSVNTLQLASFTVQIDRFIQELIQLKEWFLVEELQRTKRTVMQLYEIARMPVSDVDGLVNTEREIRKVVVSTVWIMMSLREHDPTRSDRYQDIFVSLLEMEWLRRNKILENTPNPINIWEV